MRQFSSILLLALFCVHSFNFKTHYCFNTDDETRFHGECEDHNHAHQDDKGETSWQTNEHTCYDIGKEVQTQKPAALNIDPSSTFLVSTVYFSFQEELPLQEFYPSPELYWDDGPPLQTNLLRGPPAV